MAGRGRPKLYKDPVDHGIRFSGALYEQLSEEATSRGLSFNAYVVLLLERRNQKESQDVMRLMGKIERAKEALR